MNLHSENIEFLVDRDNEGEDDLGLYTVLQMLVRGKPVLIFGESGHAAVATAYLSLHHLSFEADPDKEFKERGIEYLVPRVRGQDYEIVGAGEAWVKEDKKVIEFSGKSHNYNLGINIGHLEQVLGSVPEWKWEVQKQQF